jgi:hypothetical protein
LKPTHLIALGDTLWTNMPEFDGKELTRSLGGRDRQCGFYVHDSGEVIATSIQHPSSAFSSQSWHSVVKDFLAIKPRTTHRREARSLRVVQLRTLRMSFSKSRSFSCP